MKTAAYKPERPRRLSVTRRFGLSASYLQKTNGSISVICPGCGNRRSAVVDARPVPDGRFRRRRCCMNCELRFTTYEQVAAEFILDYQI